MPATADPVACSPNTRLRCRERAKWWLSVATDGLCGNQRVLSPDVCKGGLTNIVPIPMPTQIPWANNTW